MIKGYKGMDKNLRCRGHRYEIGKEYETEKKPIRCTENGFHFCENPLDVFGYYPPADSRFCEVEGDGEVSSDENDSKVAVSKLHIKCEIGLIGLIGAGVKFIMDKIDFKDAAATNTGDSSAATNTGYRSAATNTGDSSAATNTGYSSAATNTGDRSAAEVSGKESVAMAIGYESKAAGALGCWIVLSEWEKRIDGYHIKTMKCAFVDGKKIKAGVFYMLSGGKFVKDDKE